MRGFRVYVYLAAWGKEATHTQNLRVKPTPDQAVHKLWADGRDGGLEGSFNLIFPHSESNSAPELDPSKLRPQTLIQTPDSGPTL